MKIQARQENHRGFDVAGVLIGAALVIALMMAGMGLLGIPARLACVALIAVLIPALLEVVGWRWPEKKMQVFYGLALLPVLVGAVGFRYTVAGMGVVLNQCLATVGAASRTIYMPFAVSVSAERYLFAAMFFLCLVTAVLAVLVAWEMQRRFPVIPGVLVVAMGVCQLLWHSMAHPIYLVLAVLAEILAISNWFLKRRDISPGNHLHQGISTGILCAVSALAMVVLVVVIPMNGFQKDPYSAKAKEKVDRWERQTRYENGKAHALPQGDFTRLSDLNFSQEAMLEITGAKIDSMYLRGFVGGAYTEKGWERIGGKTLYTNADQFYWLHKDGLYGQSMLALSAKTLTKLTEEDTLSLKVKNVGAETQYFYTPYEMTELAEGKKSSLVPSVLDDESIESRNLYGVKEYQLKKYENQVKCYPDIVASLAKNKNTAVGKQYLSIEKKYNAFVYDTYTKLSKKDEKLLENHLRSYDKGKRGNPHLDYRTAKAVILNYLGREVKYSTAATTSTGSRGFLANFLEISKAGYSVHYATAATLMFRHYGIPARYVEGYLVTPAMVKKAGGKGKITVTDQQAHAWVEYYQDGVGWIPFEVTPPYMNVMEKPKGLSSISPLGTQGDSEAKGQALKMDKDNYEPQEPKKEEKKREIPWKTIGKVIRIALLSLLALVLLIHFLRRERKIRRRKREFTEGVNRNRVLAIFDYVGLLHRTMKVQQENQSIFEDGRSIEEKYHAPEWAEKYREAAEIYQKAAFSPLEISDQEVSQVREYAEYVIAMMKKEFHLLKRGWLRWMRGLY